MTGAALTGVMIRRAVIAVAGLTVRLTCVAKGNLTPGLGGMARATLTRKMVGRTIISVTGPASGEAGVVKFNLRPAFGAEMTLAALAGIVVGRGVGAMATLAIGGRERNVVEISPEPPLGRVAHITLHPKFPLMRLILGMARLASGGRSLESIARMAPLARNGHMFPLQWKRMIGR